MSALLFLQFDPHKCPCCWDVASYDGTSRGACHADCMPFSATYGGCPLMSTTGPACRSTALMSGATLTYTPKCANDFNGSGSACVYKTAILTNADCNCSGQWVQYCIDDANGNRGRSWVVEFFCKDNVSLVVSTFTVVVTDWLCLCDGAAHGYANGAGARFGWSLTIGGCCCNDCSMPDCTCEPPFTLYVDVAGCWTASGIVLEDVGGGCWESTGAPPLTAEINSVSLCCTGDEWILTLNPVAAPCINFPIWAATAGTCSPFSLEWDSFTLDSDCCGPSGGSVTATVSE